MSYECKYCNFHASTNTRLNRHISTQKHARNVLSKQISDESNIIVSEIIDEIVQENVVLEEVIKLCQNMDCERYPPDWDLEEDTAETYQEGQWGKCNLCDGYFNNDGLCDILFIEEEPNNQEASCNLCGKDKNIVQMKGTGEYICGDACDESDLDDE